MAAHNTIGASTSSIMDTLTHTEQPCTVPMQSNTLARLTKVHGSSRADENVRTDRSKAEQDPTTQVFGINELVGLILEHVPTQSRSQLRRICKAWNATIIDIGHAINPIDPILAGFSIPCYEVDFEIRLNPFLRIYSSPKRARIGLPQPDIAAFQKPTNPSLPMLLAARRDEFATSPPITTIMLALRPKCTPECLSVYNHHATLKVRSGIRIGHLVDMFNQLDALPREALRNALPCKALRPRVSVAYFTLRSPGSKTIPRGVDTYKVPTIVIDD
jgi:hypothetical protein